MKVGQVVGPKLFAGAWWTIKCLDRTVERTNSFNEVKEDCKTSALVAKGYALNGKRLDKEFADYVQAANIQPFRPYYRDAVSFKK
jgi:hypothetical protein